MRRAVLIGILALLLLPASAQAAFPGHNGKIAFVSNTDGDDEIYTINPNGTGLTQLTHNTVRDWQPSWSPDGTRLMFSRSPNDIWIMNADGTDETLVKDITYSAEAIAGWAPDGKHMFYADWDVACESDAFWVADTDGANAQKIPACPSYIIYRSRWSPDGQKLVFRGFPPDFEYVYTINADGTGLTEIAFAGYDPDWSPDASTIIFSRFDPPVGLFTVPRNGGTMTQLTTEGSWPSWSPDGSKIVYMTIGSGLKIANSDGTNPTPLIAASHPANPDWQPIPFTGYPRPMTATPMHASLALAYEPCTSPNRTHGPPLEEPSCNPPQRLSHLTVGTFDANGEAAKAVGSVRFAAVGETPIDPNNGDQSDVKIQVKIADVRNSVGLSDYAGDVGVSTGRRMTDRNNTPAPGTATVQDDLFSFSVPCSPTADGTLGSTCKLDTTADTLVPGTVVERQRAVWELGRIAVHDGGPDADPQTSPGNRPFMTQGIFVP